jgi:peroxiredoxin
LADYQNHSERITGQGAELMAVAAEEPERIEDLRKELGLTFPILCDANKEMLPTWDLLNRWELGGISRPAVAVIMAGRQVRFIAKGKPAERVAAEALVAFLKEGVLPVNTEITLP